MPALLMVAASLAFAAMSACVKLAATHGVPLGQIIFYRGAVSLVMVYGYLRWRGLPLGTPYWKEHASRSIVGFGSMIAFFGAISRLPLATAVTISYLSPLILGLMLLVVHRERPQPVLVLAILGGLSGVVLLLRPTYESSQSFGALLALTSAFAAAASALSIRTLSGLQEPPWRVVLYFTLFVTVAALPWFLLSRPAAIDGTGMLYLLGTGAFATVGQFLYTLAYVRGPTLLISMLGYSQVVFTSVLGYLLWHDVLGWMSWVGIALITASGLLATTILRRNPAQAQKAVSG